MVDLTHKNSKKASTIHYWHVSDNKENYDKNIQDPDTLRHYLDNGWVDETSIIYQYNSLGFRCVEFDQRASYIAIGCSFTEGVGLREDQTWVNYLSKQLGTHVWNLGVAGIGISSCFRLLDGYIDALNPLGVFMLTPSSNRLECRINGRWTVAMPWFDCDIPGYKEWVSDSNNTQLEHNKSIAAIKYLCACKNIDFFQFPTESVSMVDWARDIHSDYAASNSKRIFDWGLGAPSGHPGPKTNELIAAEFYKRFVNR
jgi:hypothetical protein